MNYKEYNEKDLQSFEYETTIQSDGKIIGVCELGKATIQMINDSNNYSTYKDSWIKTVHGSFYVYNVEPVQEKVNIKLECYDIKYKLDTPYDKTKYIFPLTLKEWRNEIFNNCSVEYDNSDFPNSNLTLKESPYVEDGCSNRDVIKAIGEAGCSTIITDSNDKFYFSWFDNVTPPFYVKDWLELSTEKEKSKPINLVVLGRGDAEDNIYFPTEKPEVAVEFRIDNNYILDSQEIGNDEDQRFQVIQPIFNRVNEFSYLIFNMRSQSIDNKLALKLGQRIQYKDIWNNELVAYVMTKKIKWLGGILNNPDNYEIILSAKEIKESSTDLSYAASIKNDILKVERKTDKNTGAIQDLVEQTSEFDSKMTNVNQTMDKLSQSLTDIEILERDVSGKNYIYIKNAAKGFLKDLTIEGPISLVYPDNNLYPDNDLYPVDSYLIVDKSRELSSEAKKIHLPFFEIELGEKFVVEDGKCRIEKVNGDVMELSNISIELFEGENYLYLESFQESNLNFFAKYIIKNQYTDCLATKLEMNNAITQTNERTDIELSKKVGEEKIIAAINMSTEKDKDGSYIGINADKLDLKGKEFNLTSDNIAIISDNFKVDKNGKISASAGQIGGFNISKYTLYGNHIKGECLYTKEDVTKIRNYLAYGDELTDEEKQFYDINGDGILNAVDWIQMKNLVENKDKEISVELNTKFLDKFFNIRDENDNYIARIGNLGAFFEKLRINKEFSFYPDNENFSLYSSIGVNESDLIINLDKQKMLSQIQINSYDGNTNDVVITFDKSGNITCKSLTQTSLESNKKNIQKYFNALKELDNIDIYQYNLKEETDDTKKHLGFVIGKNFKHSNLVTSPDDKGVDNYSFTSLCFQMIKEQQSEIKELQNELKELKERIINGKNISRTN